MVPLLRSGKSALCFVLCLATASLTAQPAPTGGISAFLPMVATVPMVKRLPIDGDWIVSTIRKQIRIEAGRAYALDGWQHALILRVQPGMVVLRDIERLDKGRYAGQDLPLAGRFTAQLGADGVLNVTVSGILGEAKYQLIPVSTEDAAAFEQERAPLDRE